MVLLQPVANDVFLEQESVFQRPQSPTFKLVFPIRN